MRGKSWDLRRKYLAGASQGEEVKLHARLASKSGWDYTRKLAISSSITEPIYADANIDISFDELIDTTTFTTVGDGTGSCELYNNTAREWVAGAVITDGNPICSFNPTANLVTGDSYTLYLSSAIAGDASGRAYDDTDYTFTAETALILQSTRAGIARTVTGYASDSFISDGTALLNVPANIPALTNGRYAESFARGATLGAELITNTTWSTSPAVPNPPTDAITITGDVETGTIRWQTNGTYIAMSKASLLTVDDIYQIQVDTTEYTGFDSLALDGNGGGTVLIANQLGVTTVTFVATSTTLTIKRKNGLAMDATIKASISVKKVTPAWMDVEPDNTLNCWGDSLTFGADNQPFPSQFTVNHPTLLTINNGAGGETSTQIKTRFLAADPYPNQVAVIWAGRNNYLSGATVQSDIAAMVAAIGHTNYIVLEIPNNSSEVKGTGDYNSLIALNDALETTYGAKFLRIREILVASYDPSLEQDVLDFANDVTPTSLRDDILHFNSAGLAIVADSVYDLVNYLAYTSLAAKLDPTLSVEATDTYTNTTPSNIDSSSMAVELVLTPSQNSLDAELFNMTLDASNDLRAYYSDALGTLIFERNNAASGDSVNVTRTTVTGTKIIVRAYADSSGFGLAAYNDGDAQPAFATDPDTKLSIITSTFSVANVGGASIFPCEFESIIFYPSKEVAGW